MQSMQGTKMKKEEEEEEKNWSWSLVSKNL